MDVLATRPDNVCAGFCYYKPEPNDPEHSIQIMFLAVRKEFQKHGCGRLLVSLAINNAKQGARIRRVRLMAAEKAIPFYETIGFRREEKDEDDMSNWMEDLLYSNSSSVWMEIPVASPERSPIARPQDLQEGFIFEEPSLVYNAFGLPSTEWPRSPSVLLSDLSWHHLILEHRQLIPPAGLHCSQTILCSLQRREHLYLHLHQIHKSARPE